MQKSNIIILVLLLTFCILNTTATNQPYGCTSTLTNLNTGPFTIGQQISLKLTTGNAPVILTTSYCFTLYQNGVAVRNDTVAFIGGYLSPINVITYTFTGVTINDPHTVFYADITANLVIFPLVYIRSNNVTVDARYPTNSSIDSTIASGSGLSAGSGDILLFTRLFVIPQVPANQPGPTDFTNPNDKHYCYITVDNQPYDNTTSGVFRRSADNDFDTSCRIGLILQGQVVHVEVYFRGDNLYAPSAFYLDFVGKPGDQAYNSSDITVTYFPSGFANRALLTESSSSQKVKKAKREKKVKKNRNDRRRRSYTALE
eukprot:TRINITY_DN35_c0_g1_i6.p1 TRINITY_DN35_c0_g1~~TRINITY_DN35_c0_g1_i6.p1  ORF type:complete len:315 (-),score=22.91 TRINITY_DN35_c0_g1_i6:44-988(-)